MVGGDEAVATADGEFAAGRRGLASRTGIGADGERGAVR